MRWLMWLLPSNTTFPDLIGVPDEERSVIYWLIMLGSTAFGALSFYWYFTSPPEEAETYLYRGLGAWGLVVLILLVRKALDYLID